MDISEILHSPDMVEDELDYDYSVSEIHIDRIDDFDKLILQPFLTNKANFLYRGEQVNSLKNPLLPSLLRDRDRIIPAGENYVDITSEYLLEFYKARTDYFSLFSSLFGHAETSHLYDLCAFSQHYMGCSPFIDFSKSPYVALSFALNGRTEFDDHVLLYVINIDDSINYTQSVQTANQWLKEYHVRVYHKSRENRGLLKLEQPAPTAKIIDIASNDSMKFQQGVFLLLDDFSMVGQLYFTKKVRSNVNISKYVIDRSICRELGKLIEIDAPWYSYHNLMEIRAGIRTAIKHQHMENFK